jgi:hypothetical protein
MQQGGESALLIGRGYEMLPLRVALDRVIALAAEVVTDGALGSAASDAELEVEPYWFDIVTVIK